ncbi:MAG TPA: YkgJ family cysteine cluster protein [Gemmatimonadales bacterium]|nr:YkgJ family cysteine cluster protein [Gemmatimonadales bacterium]
MTRATDPRTGPLAYRLLLERLETWFAEGRARHGSTIPCRGGCSACCHGPFDISVADVELLVDAVRRLPVAERATVEARSRALLERMRELEPGWAAPHDVAALGDERFDRLADALAAEPCPLLDAEGRCRIYDDRPLVCRLTGLGMVTPAGRVIENACPIQADFPAYAALPPVPFDLEDLEVEEWEAMQGAARRLLGSAAYVDYETTIAAAIVDHASDAAGARPPEPA